MSEDEKAEHDEEYVALLALYLSLVRNLNTDDEDEALYELMAQRADYAIRHALNGLGVDYAVALQLLSNMDDNNLTQHDKDLRDRIDAAILNLIDFSVCEEYQLYNQSLELLEKRGIDLDFDDYDDFEYLCSKFNDVYAAVENSDITYAGAMAAWWIKLSAADYVVYWTQNDSRVRPWHMALQGYAAPRDEFPSWMIPPIEYNCRCFLQSLEYPIASSSAKDVRSAIRMKKPKELSGVYSESLAKCGKIFSSEHPYFLVKEKDKERLKGFVERIKVKYYG